MQNLLWWCSTLQTLSSGKLCSAWNYLVNVKILEVFLPPPSEWNTSTKLYWVPTNNILLENVSCVCSGLTKFNIWIVKEHLLIAAWQSFIHGVLGKIKTHTFRPTSMAVFMLKVSTKVKNYRQNNVGQNQFFHKYEFPSHNGQFHLWSNSS